MNQIILKLSPDSGWLKEKEKKKFIESIKRGRNVCIKIMPDMDDKVRIKEKNYIFANSYWNGDSLFRGILGRTDAEILRSMGGNHITSFIHTDGENIWISLTECEWNYRWMIDCGPNDSLYYPVYNSFKTKKDKEGYEKLGKDISNVYRYVKTVREYNLLNRLFEIFAGSPITYVATDGKDIWLSFFDYEWNQRICYRYSASYLGSLVWDSFRKKMNEGYSDLGWDIHDVYSYVRTEREFKLLNLLFAAFTGKSFKKFLKREYY